MTTVVSADNNDSFHQQVVRLCEELNLDTQRIDTNGTDPAAAAEKILAENPGIVVVGLAEGIDSALGVIEALDLANPGVSSILVTEPGAERWQQALRAGARDLVAPNATDTEFREALERAKARTTARPKYAAAPDGAPSSHTGGRVVTIVSPKGGSGKTMLATNLAYGLHHAGRGQVVIADFDLQFGDVAGALALRPEYSVSNALQASDDPTATKSFLTSHPSGMFALCAPTNPAEADSVDPVRLKQLVGTLQDNFDWVIVDTSAGITEANLTAIESATDVIVVATTDLSAIQAMRKAVVVLDQIGLTDHHRWYLLNRANARVGLDQGDIERSTGLDIDGTIPSSRSVPIAMNQGVPVISDDPRAPASRALREFMLKLAPSAAGRGSDEDKGWLRRIRQ